MSPSPPKPCALQPRKRRGYNGYRSCATIFPAPLMPYFRDNIERMQGYTPGFQPREPGFIKLNTNENPRPPSPRVVKAMKAACEEGIRKYPDPLATAFRMKAAEVFGVRPERIMCGFGSDDILTIAVRAFCGEGDLLAFAYPSYSLYGVLAEIQGARALCVQFPDDFSLPEGLVGTDAQLTLLANPNAPSATMLPVKDVRLLAKSLKGILLVDEAYVDFAEWNCLGLLKDCKNVIVMRTLSKSYSLAGLRFGFALASEEIIRGLTKVKDSYNASFPAIAGATAAIADQKHLARNVAKIKATRTRLIRGLEELGCFCWPSQANFVLTRVPEGRDAERVFNDLFARKILVRYFKAPRLDDCLRITVGTDEEIDALLEALGDILS